MLSIGVLWALVTPKARRDFFWLTLFSAIAGLLETTSIGLIIPFIATATGTSPFGLSSALTDGLKSTLGSLGVGGEWMTFALGMVFLLGTSVASATVVYYQLFSLRVVYGYKAVLSTSLLAKISNQPIGWFERQNSAELSKSLMTDVDRVVASLSSLAQLLGILVRCAILSGFFLLAQTRLALTLALSLGISFLMVFRFVQRPLEAAAQQSLRSLEHMYTVASEVFSGSREMKATNTREFFLGRFRGAAREAVQPEILRGMPPHVTRMALETMVLATTIGVLIYFHHRDGNLGNGLPLLSAYAVAGIRILPPLQQALFHWVQIRFLEPSSRRVRELMEEENLDEKAGDYIPIQRFREAIEVKSLSFGYSESEPVLHSLSLRIQKNQRVAFVGSTGAGKSTLMDLLLGLRTPSQGEICIDGVALTARNRNDWLGQSGYVPQSVYLLDSTVAENVAFGENLATLSQARVEDACRAASIHEFVESELCDGYLTRIGERGARLSGGQCQRLGIARALYHDPEVVFFDEATSSLDGATEEAILLALERLKGKKTLIVVAHRLNTVWGFDCLFVLDKGRLVGEGKAEDLLQSCPAFAALLSQSPSGV